MNCRKVKTVSLKSLTYSVGPSLHLHFMYEFYYHFNNLRFKRTQNINACSAAHVVISFVSSDIMTRIWLLVGRRGSGNLAYCIVLTRRPLNVCHA